MKVARFNVIGVALDLSPLPFGDPNVSITVQRVQSLLAVIRSVILTSGQAASLSGKLGFALCTTFGRFGRCMLRPIAARAYSRKRNLCRKLLVCLHWWTKFLLDYRPRSIPVSMSALPLLISYSDGEGGCAGIGATLWSSEREDPLALYTEVPDSLRAAWSSGKSSEPNDIFIFEAAGPLLLLLTFHKLHKNSRWIHFIDNTPAKAALVRGSSSPAWGERIVGLT